MSLRSLVLSELVWNSLYPHLLSPSPLLVAQGDKWHSITWNLRNSDYIQGSREVFSAAFPQLCVCLGPSSLSRSLFAAGAGSAPDFPFFSFFPSTLTFPLDVSGRFGHHRHICAWLVHSQCSHSEQQLFKNHGKASWPHLWVWNTSMAVSCIKYIHTALCCYLCVCINGIKFILIRNQFIFYLRTICFNGEEVAVPSPCFGVTPGHSLLCESCWEFFGWPSIDSTENKPFSLICISLEVLPVLGMQSWAALSILHTSCMKPSHLFIWLKP